MHPRMKREQYTIEKMIGIYCRAHHQSAKDQPCPDCRQLLAYALLRLRRCPFQEGKTTCGNCAVHCYHREKRQQIRAVMRFAGPRMVWRHPLLALGHLFDGFRKQPVRKKRTAAQ